MPVKRAPNEGNGGKWDAFLKALCGRKGKKEKKKCKKIVESERLRNGQCDQRSNAPECGKSTRNAIRGRRCMKDAHCDVWGYKGNISGGNMCWTDRAWVPKRSSLLPKRCSTLRSRYDAQEDKHLCSVQLHSFARLRTRSSSSCSSCTSEVRALSEVASSLCGKGGKPHKAGGRRQIDRGKREQDAKVRNCGTHTNT